MSATPSMQRDPVLDQFLGRPQAAQEKTAEEKIADEEIAKMFFASCHAAGYTDEQLCKFAGENPTGYQELFDGWLIKAGQQVKEAQEREVLTKQAEAERMEKVAEAIWLGRITAHAIVDELTNMGQYLQKIAAEDEKKETPAEEKKEDEKKDEDKGEKKDEGKPPWLPTVPPKAEDEKVAAARAEAWSKLPQNVRITARTLEKAAAAGHQYTPEEEDFLATVNLAMSGADVKWSQ